MLKRSAYLSYRLIILIALFSSACVCVPRNDENNHARVLAESEKVRKSWPVDEVDFTELNEAPAQILVDNRSLEEFEISHIPGAIHISQFDEKSAKGKRIVVYCTIGERSGRYVTDLNKRGIPALNYPGSLLDWLHNGGKIEDSTGNPTHWVHPYSKSWDFLPRDYKACFQKPCRMLSP